MTPTCGYLAKSVAVWLLLLAGCVLAAIAQDPQPARDPLVTIDVPDAGRIVYGKVDGADTFANAFQILENELSEKSGARLQTGHAFRMRGTETEGLFFTLPKHGTEGEPVAGLILAVADEDKQIQHRQIEVAILSDRAERFGATINPMLTKLFGVWHPSGLDAAIALHTVELEDKSASVGLPEGWKLDPGWSGGAMIVTGPHDERIAFDLTFFARDPKNPMVKRLIATSAGNKNAPKYLDRPYDADLAKAFPEIVQQLRKEFGQAPVKLVAAHTESIPAPKGERCIYVTGTVDPDGAGDRDTEFHFCSSSLTRYGTYEIRVSQALFPKTVSEQDRATFDAIEASFQSNIFLIAAQQEEAADMYIPEHHGGDVAARFSFVVRIHEMEEDASASRERRVVRPILDGSQRDSRG